MVLDYVFGKGRSHFDVYRNDKRQYFGLENRLGLLAMVEIVNKTHLVFDFYKLSGTSFLNSEFKKPSDEVKLAQLLKIVTHPSTYFARSLI